MTSDAISTEALSRLAEDALAASGSDDFADKLALYTESFSRWAAAHAALLAGAEKPQNEAQFRYLADVHAKLVASAEAARDQARKDIGEAHKRGKGIMAYTDILPKRISISGVKRG